MPVSPVQGATSQTGQAMRALKLGADDFFKLLVTQIQNQDPLKPMDDKEFIAQTAQFTQLEETRAMGEWLQLIAGNTADNNILQVAGLIGRQATAGYGAGKVTGTVSAVCLESGTIKVVIGGTLVNASDIVEIREA